MNERDVDGAVEGEAIKVCWLSKIDDGCIALETKLTDVGTTSLTLRRCMSVEECVKGTRRFDFPEVVVPILVNLGKVLFMARFVSSDSPNRCAMTTQRQSTYLVANDWEMLISELPEVFINILIWQVAAQKNTMNLGIRTSQLPQSLLGLSLLEELV